MKNQLLNLKMIALMCLMMVLGGANVWAADKITDVANIVSGGKYYIGATTSNKVDCYLKINGSSISTGKQGEPTENISEATIFVLEKSESGWVIKFDGTTNYLALSSSKGGKLDIKSTPSIFKFENLGGLIYMTSQNYALRRNSTYKTKRFGSYSTGTGNNAMLDVWLMPATPAKALTSLAISGEPTKTTYNVGEEFDPTGLVVTGTYDDNTTATITNGITWTKNPEKMSLGNTSCIVTASVGEVKSEPFEVNGLNVVKAIVFDFTANPNVWSIEPSSNNDVPGDNVVTGKELKVDEVVMTSTNGTNASHNATCLFKTSGGDITLRVYVGGSITFTAPEGYNLSEISFTGAKFSDKSVKKFSTTEKELTISSESSATWMGNAHAVTFNALASVQFKTATIKLVAVEPVKPTFGTLDFKAQDGDGFRYATFSSDKDVVFNQKSVDVYAVSVSNEKVDTKILDAASYNVTDATVGSIEKGYYVPANTGVLIVGYDATTTYYFPAEAQTVTLPANQLKPAPANGGVFKATADYKYYKLAYGDWTDKTQLGFYWGADNGGAFYVKAGTAYLAVPAGKNAAKGFTLNGEATGIDGVNANVENAKAIYNLNGQRVASMAKPGLYIVNGKKVVRK